MGKATPWRARVDELLEDGEWHRVEDIVRDAMRYVPPGQAFRRGEALRKRQGGPEERQKGSDRDAVMVGARSMTRDAIRSGPMIELGEIGGEQVIRLRKMTLGTEDITTVRSALHDAIDMLQAAVDQGGMGVAEVKGVLACLQDATAVPTFSRRDKGS